MASGRQVAGGGDEQAAWNAAEAGSRQRSPGGHRPARSVHAAAGRGRRAGQVQALDRRLGTAEAGGRAEDELLEELRRPAVDRAVHEVAVAGLQVAGQLVPAVDDQVTEARGVRLDRPSPSVGPVRRLCRGS